MKTTRRERERGTQLIELALVLPMLLMLAVLVSEGASVLHAHIVLNNAAREGAHLASLPENDCTTAPSYGTCISNIQNAVVAYAAANNITITTANVTVNESMVIPNNPVNMAGSQVTVSYAYPLTFVPAIINAWFGGVGSTVTLTGQAEFRNFY